MTRGLSPVSRISARAPHLFAPSRQAVGCPNRGGGCSSDASRKNWSGRSNSWNCGWKICNKHKPPLRPEGLPVQNRDAQTVSSYYFSFACQLLAFGNAVSIPKSNRDNELSEARKRRKVLRLVPSCSPKAPSMARTRGGSVSATLRSRLRRPCSDRRANSLWIVSSGLNSLNLAPRLRISSRAASVSGLNLGRCLRHLAGWPGRQGRQKHHHSQPYLVHLELLRRISWGVPRGSLRTQP